MINLLWLAVAILIIAWVLGLGVLQAGMAVVWMILILALVVAVLAVLTGGYLA